MQTVMHECEKCGAKTPVLSGQEVFHQACPKRGRPGTNIPKYVPVKEKS